MRKWKNLVPLVVILAILSALVVLKQVQNRPVAIEDHLRERMTALVPEMVSPGTVTKLELYAGAVPETRVVLERDAADPNTWRVSSHFNAPARTDRIEEILTKLSGLQGELRARGVTGEDLTEFELGDDEAFHVAAYVSDGEAPAAHVLSGKAPRSGQVFVREAGGDTVYVGDVNFRREAQVWSDDPAAVPEAGAWTDKRVAEVERDEVVKVALTMPDKELVFEKREVAVDEAEEEDAEEEGLALPAEPEYEWVLTSGGLAGQEFKQAGLDTVLNALASLDASEIVDPENLEEWALAEPGFRCVLTLGETGREIVLEGGRPESSADGYVRLAPDEEPLVVYKLSAHNFGRVFPKGSDLFDLQSLSLARDSLTRIEMELPEGTAVLVQEDDAWAVYEPVADLDVDTTAITTLAGALASWKASDYTDTASLGSPVRRVRFSTDTGESHLLEIGGFSKSIDGNYARLDGGAVVAMSKGDVAKVLVEPRNLYRRALLAAHANDVLSVRITPPDGPEVLLARDGAAGWMLGDAGADPDAAEELAETIAGLQAEDILFAKSPDDFEPWMAFEVSFEDGTVHTLTLGRIGEAGSELMLDDKSSVFLISPSDADTLASSLDAVKLDDLDVEPEPETAEPQSVEIPIEEVEEEADESADARESVDTSGEADSAPREAVQEDEATE